MTLDGQVANTPARESWVAGQQVHVNVELADDTRWDAQKHRAGTSFMKMEHIPDTSRPAWWFSTRAGTPDGTVLNAPVAPLPGIAEVPAPVSYRLDKDATGLMVVAKTISRPDPPGGPCRHARSPVSTRRLLSAT